jgi:hypothetical protein
VADVSEQLSPVGHLRYLLCRVQGTPMDRTGPTKRRSFGFLGLILALGI